MEPIGLATTSIPQRLPRSYHKKLEVSHRLCVESQWIWLYNFSFFKATEKPFSCPFILKPNHIFFSISKNPSGFFFNLTSELHRTPEIVMLWRGGYGFGRRRRHSFDVLAETLVWHWGRAGSRAREHYELIIFSKTFPYVSDLYSY